MLIQVNPHKIVLIKTNDVNSGEYNVNECTFEFSQEFDNLTCIAVFSLCDGTTKNITILNNRCIIPTEVLTQTGQVKIGVYGYSVQDDELVLRYSPTPQIFVVTEGSYKEGTEPVAPTPTDWEILVEQVSDNSRDISNIKEDITGINGEISGINIDIRDLQDTKANINDLSAVAFSGSYNDLINKPNLSVYATKTDLSDEATLRENADVSLQEQIDAISVSSDVVDVVGTYQELLNYDTQHLKDNDIVKVLVDSTHNDALSYYRWDKEPQTWSYIGSEGPFYTKAETQELLNAKEDKITTTNKLDADLVDDTNSNNKFVTETDITNWNNKEDKSNKVTEINSSSTDTEYPSAKCVYDSQEEQNEEIAELEMLYNAFPTVSDEDTTIQLDNTAKVKFREIDLKGNTSQVVIPEEQGTSVSNTSIYVSDVDTDKESTIEISGNTYQETTTGKNYFKASSSNFPQGLTITNDTTTGEITFSGTTTGSYPTLSNFADANVPAGEYTFSIDKTLPYNLSLRFRNASGQYPTTITIPTGSLYASATTTYITTRLEIVYAIATSGITVPTTTIKPMLESGSTATSFEPFTNGASPNPSYPQNIEVVTGQNDITIYKENLFDGEMELGMVHYDTGLNTKDDDRARSKGYIPLFSNTYSIIREEAFSSGQTIGLRFYDSNFNYIGRDAINNFTNYATKYVDNSLDTTKTVAYMRFILMNTNDMSKKFCVVNGESTTFDSTIPQTYPVNLGNIELCKIDTYQDRIYKQNDKWYLEKKIGKVIFTGATSENWTLAQTQTNTLRFNNDNGLPNGLAISIIKTISNKFINGSNINDNEDYEHIRNAVATYPTTIVMLINKSRLNEQNVNGFKEWLSSNNVTVYYLITPTTTEITDITLVNQLNALYNATIYPITNINTDTSNLLPYIDLHYNFVTPSPSPSRPSVVNVVKGENTITICSKNLFNDTLELGTINSSGYNTSSTTNTRTVGYTKLEANKTYTISSSISCYIAIRYYDSNKTFLSSGTTAETPNTFTTPSNVVYARFVFTNMTNTNALIQLEKGSTATTYETYKSQVFPINLGDIELCKIGTYQDYIYENNGNWFKKNNVKVATDIIGSTSKTISDMVSNATIYSYCGGTVSGTTITYTSELLVANTIYYPTTTPTDTQITDTTLITQLNNIKKAYSYDTQTNISQTNTDKPFIIYAEAIRSLKDVFE